VSYAACDAVDRNNVRGVAVGLSWLYFSINAIFYTCVCIGKIQEHLTRLLHGKLKRT
jgi:hypothetical protein